MKKKIFTLAFMVVMLVCLAICVSAAEPNKSGETFTLTDGTVLPIWDTDGNGLVWYKSTANADDGYANYDYVSNNQTDSSVMPYISCSKSYYSRSIGGKSYDGYQVTNIVIHDSNGSYAVSGGDSNGKAVSVVLVNWQGAEYSDGIVYNMFNKTFKNSDALEALYIDESSLFALEYSFSYCDVLRYINIGETNLLEMGTACVAESRNLVFTLPENLISLGSWSLQNTAIREITIPESVTTCYDSVFKSCASLENVYGYHEMLERMIKNNGSAKIEGNMFYDCKNLNSPFENNIIPEGVSSIGSYAFRKCEKLTNITIPNTVTTISTGAFMNCTGLVTVNLGAAVNNIKNYDVLNSCTSLTTIYMPETLTSIPINTFKNSSKITTVYFEGELSQLESLIQTATDSTGNTPFTNLEKISYENYKKLEDKSGKYIIYDYNTCKAFYNDVHNYTKNAENAYACVCSRGNCTNTEQIFSGFLYATRQENDGNCGLVFTYEINNEILAVYEKNAGTTIVFGALSVAKHNLSGTSPINATDGKANQDKVIRAQLSGTGVYHVDYIIRGQADAWNAPYGDATVKDVNFYILGYVIENGAVKYFLGDSINADITKIDTITYNGATKTA